MAAPWYASLFPFSLQAPATQSSWHSCYTACSCLGMPRDVTAMRGELVTWWEMMEIGYCARPRYLVTTLELRQKKRLSIKYVTQHSITRWQRSVGWDWRFVYCNNTDKWLLLKTYTWRVFQACICIVWLAVLRPLRTVPQCDHYGTCRTSYPFLPAPPGRVPSCAKPGYTFCEKIDHYPTWVPNGKVMNHITTCIRRGGINPCILNLDITRRHVISFTPQPFYNRLG
jgi:hypothetical protein